jgi:two-component sensor histidine kinase
VNKIKDKNVSTKPAQAKKTKKQLINELVELRQRISELEGSEARHKLREERLKRLLIEKEILTKEVHHRVKNNMQIIYSLLSLQSRRIKDKNILKMLQESQNRVRSMALLHEKLYQSNDLAKIEFGDYIRKLVYGLFHTYAVSSDSIILKINAENIYLDINTAIPCGLIINELVSNSLKHAFPEGKGWSEKGETKGQIYIKLTSHNKNNFTLIIRDNGVGFPEDLDFRKTESLGLQLVNTLVEQLEGSIKLLQKDGTSFKIEFTPIKRKRPPH